MTGRNTTYAVRNTSMKTPNQPFFSDGAGNKILLIGDIGKAFLDADTITEEVCEVFADLPNAVDAARKNNFAVIGLVIFGMSTKLSSALRTLREANSKAKIILLAQMYEEPIARQLVSQSANGISAADDYLICPIRFRDLGSGFGDRIALSSDPWHLAPDHWSKLERRIKELERLATTDDLTSLKNRRYIWEFSRQILEHARKENGRVTLLLFDIDNFKRYNDIYGHVVGDKILMQAAILMQRCCRSHDVVGRIGGDEFAAVFWDDPLLKEGRETRDERRRTSRDHPQEVIFIANRFRKELERAELNLLGTKGEGVLTISGGLAGFPRDGSTVQELFQKADKALLEAKRSGKNRIYLVGKPQSDITNIE
jgi:GGDEF domain-containing protein